MHDFPTPLSPNNNILNSDSLKDLKNKEENNILLIFFRLTIHYPYLFLFLFYFIF